jgi:hypothetical protein
MPDVRYWNDPAARQALMQRGRLALEQIQDRLAGQVGVVAIEPDEGRYFVGATLGQANVAAYAVFPDRWLYFARLDDPTAEIALPTW